VPGYELQKRSFGLGAKYPSTSLASIFTKSRSSPETFSEECPKTFLKDPLLRGVSCPLSKPPYIQERKSGLPTQQNKNILSKSQCENLAIFLQLRFYLREINFCKSAVSKSTILIVSAVSERLNFDFSEFLQFVRAEHLCTKNTNSQLLKVSKLQFLRHQLLIKLMSHNLSDRKIVTFPHC